MINGVPVPGNSLVFNLTRPLPNLVQLLTRFALVVSPQGRLGMVLTSSSPEFFDFSFVTGGSGATGGTSGTTTGQGGTTTTATAGGTGF